MHITFEGVVIGYVSNDGIPVDAPCHLCGNRTPRMWALHTTKGEVRLVTCNECVHGPQGSVADILNHAIATVMASPEEVEAFHATRDFLLEGG